MKTIFLTIALLSQTLIHADDSIYRCGNDFSDHSAAIGKGNCKSIGIATVRPQYVAISDSEKILVAGDGHFRISGLVNDQSIEFLVDTGATDVVVSPELAKKAGLSGGKRIHVVTANGDNFATLVDGVKVKIGDLPQQVVSVAVQPNLDANVGLLGQSFLKKFRMTIDDKVMLIAQPGSSSMSPVRREVISSKN
jgi:clan AA aspartic protease (TIGR02281 family)